MTYKLLLSEILKKRHIYELDATCSYLINSPFVDTESIDVFLINNAPDFFTGVTTLGCLNMFSTKEKLIYFDKQLILLYPNIIRIDVLDKDNNDLQLDENEYDSEIDKNTLALRSSVAATNIYWTKECILFNICIVYCTAHIITMYIVILYNEF